MRTRRVRGFTLVEVLVAVLVLALGVIGGAAMQLAALRTRHQSALLSGAALLASSLAERMRMNAEQMQQDDAANPYLGVDYEAVADTHPAAAGFTCFAPALCSSAQLAGFDMAEIKQQLRATLPGARLVICRDALAWDAARQGLSWPCSGAPGAPIVIKLGWRARNPDGGAAQSGAAQARARDYPPGVALTLTGAAK